ncbi:hypothetical protein LCGC14_0384110, partial [marine sediment metagenome]
YYGAPALRAAPVTEEPAGLFERMMPRTELRSPEGRATAGIELEAMRAGMRPEAFKTSVYPEGSTIRRLEQMGDGMIAGSLGTAEGMIGAVEWITGSETAKQLADVVKAHRKEIGVDPEDATFMDELAMGAGSAAIFFIPGLGIARSTQLAAKFSPAIARWSGLGMASVMEAMTESGLSFRDTIAETQDKKKAEKAANFTFWANMALLPITNALGVFGTQGKVVRRLIMSSAMEGGQEAAQDVIRAVAEGKPMPEIEQLARSAAVGAIIGGGVSAVTALAPTGVAPEESELRKDLQKLVSKYLPEEEKPSKPEEIEEKPTEPKAPEKPPPEPVIEPSEPKPAPVVTLPEEPAGPEGSAGELLDDVQEQKPIPAKPPEPGEVAEKPYVEVAEKVKESIDKPGQLTSKELFEWYDQAAGKTQAEGGYTPKDAYDAMELGINKSFELYATNARIADAAAAGKAITQLKKTINTKMPTQTRRTAESDEFQQFSTPPALAYAANWIAKPSKEDVFLEPSAGVGGIAIFGKNAGVKKVIVNELSDRRRALLKELPFDEYHGEDASQLNNILPKTVKPTLIVMNPPFSATAGRITGRRQTMEGAKHVEQGLKRLLTNGRLVAIVGRGMAHGRPTFVDWWKKIESEYTVRADIGISGQEYKKYGTTFDNRILVIDKTGPTETPPLTGEVETIEALIPLLEGVRDARTDPGKQPTVKPPGQEGDEGIEGPPGPEPVVQPAGGEAQPGERIPLSEVPRPEREPGPDVSGVVPEDGDVLPGRPGKPQPVERPAQEKKPAEPVDRGAGATAQPIERKPGGIPEAERSAGELQIKAKEKEAAGEITEDLYEGYRPERVEIPGSQRHPTPLVQSAAMAAVSPPPATYSPNIPSKVIKEGRISDIQLESVVYSGQSHEEFLEDGSRRGYFIGDGTGVGKGREIAAVIWDNWNKGRRKAMWISEKASLYEDAKRDVEGVGWNPDHVFALNKVKAGASIKNASGVMFTTYDTLKSKSKKEGVISRIQQINEWLGDDFEGVIAFDESHNMGNAVEVRGERGRKLPAAKALAGVELQKTHPKARIIYVSATGATEVLNLAYAERLGLWGEGTPFPNKATFVEKVSAGGIASMELVARDMKAMGTYNARSLSYDGVEYERMEHRLTPAQVRQYDKMADAWQTVLQNFEEALNLTGGSESGGAKAAAASAFWGAHQRFFNQIITTMSLPSTIERIHKDLDAGNSVVVQLVNTLEAAQERALTKLAEEDSLEDLDLSPFDMLMQLVEHSFPVAQFEEYVDEDGNLRSRVVEDSKGNPIQNAEAVAMREELLDELGSLRREVADNPLDQIIEEFGTGQVAEITGRKRRVIRKETDKGIERTIEKRSRAKAMVDADAFMDGKKRILVFSEAGGTGRSYHADLEAKNQEKRIHYLLQAGWRADKAVQGLGRTHRSNQKQPPKYILVTTDLKGQKRFLSSIARRLDQLGALTKGSRETGSQGIFQARDNLESEYATDALGLFYEDLVDGDIDTISVAEFEGQTGLSLTDTFGNLKKDLPPIRQFLNRLLSMNVDTMNAVFDEFSTRMDSVIEAHVQAGTLDQGLETLKADSVVKVDEQTVHVEERSGAETSYVQLDVTNKAPILSYESAIAYAKDGFYRNISSGKIWASTVRAVTNRTTGDIADTHVLKSITYGEQRIPVEQFTEDKWEKLSEAQAEPVWSKAVTETPKTIVRREHLITGALLPIWDRLTGHPRIMRVQTDAGERMIGRIIPTNVLSQTLKNLGATAGQVEMEPAEAHTRVVDQNYTLELANDWRIRRRRVSGDNRIELDGPGFSDFEILKRYGVFSERIQYQTRYFIPAGKEGVDTLGRIVKNNPIVTANPPVSAAMGAREGEGILDALSRESGYIDLRVILGDKNIERIQARLDDFRGSRMMHYYNYLRGRQDADISIVLQKRHLPQLGHWFRNMESILSQTTQGRRVYEAGRTFKEDTIRQFKQWENVYELAVRNLDAQEKRAVLRLLDTTQEIEGDHPVEVAADRIRRLLTEVRTYLIDNGKKVGYIEGYLPHIFQGKFWVTAEGLSSHKVETLGEALQIAATWSDQGQTSIKVRQDTFISPDDATMLSRRSYWRLVKAIQEKAGESIEVFDDLSATDIHQMLSGEKIARAKPRKRFFGNLMERVVNNPNFLKDLDQVMGLYFYGASRKVGQDVLWNTVQRNLDNMPAADSRLKQFIETVYMPGTLAHPTNIEEGIAKVLHDMKIKPGASGQDVRRMFHNINMVQYVYDLGLSMSSAIANASQFFVMAYPIIGEQSAVTGYRMGARAFRDPVLFAELEGEGITQGVSSITGEVLLDRNALREFRSKIRGKEGIRGFGEATLTPFSLVELMNRFSTYFAGKDYAKRWLAKEKDPMKLVLKVSPETSSLFSQAREYSARLTDPDVTRNASWKAKNRRLKDALAMRFGYELNEKVNFRAGRENLPQAIREVPVRLLSPYKSFLLNSMKYTLDTVSPKGMVKDPKKALRFTAMTFALAGVAGNPILYGLFLIINALYKELFGVDLEKELRRHNLLRGLTGKLGVDISGSVAVQLPARLQDLLGRYGKIALELGTLAVQKAQGTGTIITERKLKRQVMPAQMQRVVDAITILNEGQYITPISKTPVALDGEPWVAAVKRAVGILPAAVSKAFEEEREMQRLKRKYKGLSADLTERWSTAVKDEDVVQIDRVVRKVTGRVNDALERMAKAKNNDQVIEALTDLLFWQQWIEGKEKFKNALIRKYVPRQIEKQRKLPTYLRPEAATP